jgi:hypothetical protein
MRKKKGMDRRGKTWLILIKNNLNKEVLKTEQNCVRKSINLNKV